MNYQYGQNFELSDNNTFPILTTSEWLNIRLPKNTWRIDKLDPIFKLIEETSEEEYQLFTLYIKERFTFEDKQYIVQLKSSENKIWKISVEIVSG